MFLTNIYGIPYPAVIATGSAAPALLTTVTLNSAGAKWAWILRATAPGTIERILYHTAAVTFGGSSVFRISLQSVVNGFPDGTVDQFRVSVPAANTMNDSGIISSNGTDGGTKRTLAQGELVAVVLEITTFTAGDSLAFQRMGGTLGVVNISYAQATWNGSAWTRVTGGLALGAVKYTSPGYVHFPGVIPHVGAAGAENLFNNGSTPDEIGVRFKVPHDLLLMGAGVQGDEWAGDAELVLYEGSTQVAISPVMDAEVEATATVSGAGVHWEVIGGAAPYPLRANVEYRLTLRPSSASNVSLGEWNAIHAAAIAAMPAGAEWFRASRTNGGAFTDDGAKLPMIWLLVEPGNPIRPKPSHLPISPIPRVGRGVRGIRKQRGAWRRRIA